MWPGTREGAEALRALLYRRGGLGDTLLTFPLIEILRRRGYEITVVGNTDYFRIASEVGWADEVRSEVPEEEFDLRVIISLDGNVRPFPTERIWVVEHYLRSLGFEEEEFSRELPLEPLESSPFKGRAVLHPSSGSPKKNPDPELFFELEEFFERRGIESVYLIGEADLWLEGKISRFVRSLDPLWIAKALKSSLLYVGLDSGISHLASYVGVPSVVIYGPTDPVVWRPIGNRVYRVHLGLECSPCFPKVCAERPCLEKGSLLERLLPLLDHLLVKIHEDNFF